MDGGDCIGREVRDEYENSVVKRTGAEGATTTRRTIACIVSSTPTGAAPSGAASTGAATSGTTTSDA